jgi:hypothetical protein
MIVKVALILTVLCVCHVHTLIGQTDYTADGEPSPLEEEIRWLVNRGRFDSARENEVRSTAYTDVPATAPPLAPHYAITLSARHHSEDMARNNRFQHATVPGSAYYDPVTQPDPWDRMSAEGYNWNGAAENIAAGYASAGAAYAGWWDSGGHRRNMFNASHREIGNGYFNWSSSDYRRYYTMNLGRSGNTHFFTDTLFHDADGDGAYDQNEGRANIRVLLRVGNSTHGHSDTSADAGSFAIPIQSIPDGADVRVFLVNTTSSLISVTVPRDYDTYANLALDPGEELWIGSFAQPTTAGNVGFRNLLPPTPTINPPELVLLHEPSLIRLRWSSQPNAQYQVQWTDNWIEWTPLTPNPLPGTGGDLEITDAPSTPRFYRLLAE